MLTIWNPFLPNKSEKKRDFFDSIFEGVFDNAFRSFGLDQKKNEDGSVTIDVDVPGVKEEDINVEVSEDNVITVKGERKTATSSCSIHKSFTLPEDSDPDSLKAELKDGVLTLTLLRKQLPTSKEPKKVPIIKK